MHFLLTEKKKLRELINDHSHSNTEEKIEKQFKESRNKQNSNWWSRSEKSTIPVMTIDSTDYKTLLAHKK